MSRSIKATGKTVKEAIANGLKELNLSEDEVEIEIVAEEKKKIFGLGAAEAIVKLREKDSRFVQPAGEKEKQLGPQKVKDEAEFIHNLIKDEELQDTSRIREKRRKLKKEKQQAEQPTKGGEAIQGQEEKSPSNADESLNEGVVWIKDGQIWVKDSPDHIPTLSPGSGMQVYKNGQLIEKAVQVFEKDELKIVVDEVETETEWEIHIDEALLKVELQLQPGFKMSRMILDSPPAHHLKINSKPITTPINQLTEEEILNRLSYLHISHGIKHEEIKRACRSTQPGTFLIAEGDLPTKGKNGSIEYVIDVVAKTNQPKERKDGTLDFRDISYIPTVDRGDVIALIIPPEPGQPGKNVRGETIEADEVFPLVVHDGKGITVINGDKIVATEAGRPQIQLRGQLLKIVILPKLVHRDDVDISTGHIRFYGDVEIVGNVEPDMLVEAEGNVQIHGTVEKANIKAGGQLDVRGSVLRSTLSAGTDNLLMAELLQLLSEIIQYMDKITAAVEQVLYSPNFKQSELANMNVNSLLKIILERNFSTFTQTVRKFVEKVNTADPEMMSDEWIEFSRQLYRTFIILHPGALAQYDDLLQFINQVEEMYENATITPEHKAVVNLGYALNSHVYCSGDININGQGCYNSQIQAGGMLRVNGFIRGGEIRAQKGIELLEVGVESGVNTRIIVPGDAFIRIKTVKENTTIQVGNRAHTFLKEEYYIFARLDEQEQLKLY